MWSGIRRSRWNLAPAVVAASLALASGEAHANSWAALTAGFQDRTQLSDLIQTLAAADDDIHEMARTASGEWVLATATRIYRSRGFPAEIADRAAEFMVNGAARIDAIAVAPDGGWVVVAEDLWARNGIPPVLEDRIRQRLAAGERIKEIAFDSDGRGFVLVSGSLYALGVDIPDDLFAAIVERRESGRQIRHVSFGDAGRWILIADDWYASHDINPGAIGWLRRRSRGASRSTSSCSVRAAAGCCSRTAAIRRGPEIAWRSSRTRSVPARTRRSGSAWQTRTCAAWASR